MNIDKNILERCMKNERRAQYELYKQCFGILMGVCLRYERNKDDAEAVLNQAFLKILKNLDKYNPKVPFEAWIKRITINTIIDQYRKKSKQKVDYVDTLESTPGEGAVDYNEAEKKFDAEHLEKMIKKLPPVSQKVFNLYVVDGYNHKEIGEMLNISDGTSKWHLSFARKSLKEMLAEALKAEAQYKL